MPHYCPLKLCLPLYRQEQGASAFEGKAGEVSVSSFIVASSSFLSTKMYRKRREEGRELKEKEKMEMREVCKALGITCGPTLSLS